MYLKRCLNLKTAKEELILMGGMKSEIPQLTQAARKPQGAFTPNATHVFYRSLSAPHYHSKSTEFIPLKDQFWFCCKAHI